MVHVVLITKILLELSVIILPAALLVSIGIFLEERVENWKYKRLIRKCKKEYVEYHKQQEIEKYERELRKKEMGTHPLFYWKQTCKPR